ncbi:unnamed protein product [Rotaria magnacalcarata]|uniref:HAT C-terminal dimerisation domain-containing protein n=1 Tax=Rotaria magnacalcarata TaxID=392030 RepID=A0A816TN72_9BILA|nr:unnamed protein product [Rotaria magnacalcarata]
MNNNLQLDQPRQQASVQHQHRIPFEQLKRAVSSNLPWFFIQYEQTDNSKNRPSDISAARVIEDYFNQQGISRSLFTSRPCRGLTFSSIGDLISIPCSNAFVKGVFSSMKHLYDDKRNRMSMKLVAAELKIRFKSSLSCTEIYKFFNQNQNC